MAAVVGAAKTSFGSPRNYFYDPSGNRILSEPALANIVQFAATTSLGKSLSAPTCTGPRAVCSSGSLLNSRAALGPGEKNTPNTLDGCIDGTLGVYQTDESLEALTITTLDGSFLAPGKSVRLDAVVWAFSSPTMDFLDLYYTADANAPHWMLLNTLSPAAGGLQTLSAPFVLPSGGLQAVRGTFRYSGSEGACSAGGYTDHDDLVFETIASNPALFDGLLHVPRCFGPSAVCSSGDLLTSRGGLTPSESGAPNTLDGCPDGAAGAYHNDESPAHPWQQTALPREDSESGLIVAFQKQVLVGSRAYAQGGG